MTTERRKSNEPPLSTRSKVSSWIEELVPKTRRSPGSKPLDLDRLAAALERDDDDDDPSSRRDAA
jgi:hypothetical protein